MSKKKTYIGITENREDVFITWKLEDGKFSASGEYNPRSGLDGGSGGQCLDSIAKDFPDNEQAQRIHKVWKRWHLNDMRSGSPKQRELIETVIKPAYEEEERKRQQIVDQYYKTKQTLLKLIDKAKHSIYQKPEDIFKWLVEAVKKNYPEAKPDQRRNYTNTSSTYYLGLHGLQPYSTVGEKAVMLTPKIKEVLFYGCPKPLPSFYDYTEARLEELGRYRDPDYIVDGKAYKYGSAWLKEEIPEDVIAEIESWEEVPFEEETVVQQLIREFSISPPVFQRFNRERQQNEYQQVIKGITFNFYAGIGVQGVDAEMILSCLIDDAREGSEGFDAALEYCQDIGYEAVEANKIANALVEQHGKLESTGVWSRYVELMEENDEWY